MMVQVYKMAKRETVVSPEKRRRDSIAEETDERPRAVSLFEKAMKKK